MTNPVVALLASLGLGFAKEAAELDAKIKAAEAEALTKAKAHLAQLDQLAASAPDELRAGDARVDAAHPSPPSAGGGT